MLALPPADWISDHLFNLHPIAFSAPISWTVVLTSIALLLMTFLVIGVPRFLSFFLTALLGSIIVIGAASHGVHDGGFLSFLGMSWHVFYIWLSCGTLFAILNLAAADQGEVPGRLRSVVEVLILFIRDQVVRPIMGQDGDRFLPVILSFFSFILMANLYGLTPGSTTATGSAYCTVALAISSFTYYHFQGFRKWGLLGYFAALVPVHANMKKVGLLAVGFLAVGIAVACKELGAGSALIAAAAMLVLISGGSIAEGGTLLLWYFMFVIECIGHLAKPFALTVRLFANMAGGHAVLYVMFGIVFMFHGNLFAAGATVLGGFAVMTLELMVAFIQAYIFTMLTVVFLNGAVNPEH